jgi:hypothetical protein
MRSAQQIPSGESALHALAREAEIVREDHPIPIGVLIGHPHPKGVQIPAPHLPAETVEAAEVLYFVLKVFEMVAREIAQNEVRGYAAYRSLHIECPRHKAC